MSIWAVLIAAVASYAFGAVWYMVLAKPWMEAAGVSEDDVNRSNPVPFIISGIAAIIVAGMMRHIFFLSGIEGLGKGLIAGLGLGLFISAPWIMTNYAFAGRPFKLTMIDGGYAIGGSAIMGLVLGMMAGGGAEVAS